MKMKIENIFFTVIFSLMLVMPMLFTDPNYGMASEQENRMLAERPSVSLFWNPGEFITQYDNWFTDNFGFRENLIEIHKKIEKIGQQVQYTDGNNVYLIGLEGHQYYAGTDGALISKFQGKPFVTDDQLSRTADKLSAAKRYLDEKNIPVMMMICPDKESVYPEYYPKVIKQGSKPDTLDIFTEYMKSHTGIDVYNVRQNFLDEKNKFLLYNRAVGDLTHYNQMGAFFEHVELTKRLSTWFPHVKPFTLDDVDIIYDQDNVPTVKLKQEAAYKELDSSFFGNVELVRPFTRENRVLENVDLSLPTILLMRDSYANMQDQYIAPYFRRTIMIHWMNMGHFEEYVNLYNPDIVVFETAERQIYTFTHYMMNY